jgi:hypothetical protein
MKHILLTSALVLACTGASAQVYGGVAGGVGIIPLSCPSDASCKSNSFGYKVYLGYSDTDVIAGELGYINFGKSKYHSGDDTIHGQFKADALTVALAWRGLWGGGLTGVLRLGGASVQLKQTSDNGVYDSGNGWKPYLGLGLEYAATPNLKGAVSLDASDSGTDGGNSAVLRLFSVGVQYQY